MQIQKLHLVYFSPTQTTKSVLHTIAKFLGVQIVEHDLTDYSCRNVHLDFGPEDIVVFGFPVYGGRIPKTFCDRTANIKGHSTIAVLIATYGNREYEDSLLEMKDLSIKNGFLVAGAAAVVTEHSVIRSIASGRPDAEDMVFLGDFCRKLKLKIDSITSSNELAEPVVPGKMPYIKRIKLPMAPVASAHCTTCGLCVKKCPVRAISIHNPQKTDKGKCIGCMRCVRVCPQKARHVLKIKMVLGKLILCSVYKSNKIRKIPEMFLS